MNHGSRTHQHSHGDILDLDAEVLGEHNADIVAWLPVQTPPRHVIDLGSGTGTGTFALLARFPEARVTAVDSSAEHLQRLADKADELGLTDRVRTVQADLDATWPELGEPDLVWASASLHHVAEPEQALRRIHDLLAPGGLLAVVELSGFPRFLPADGPAHQPGLEERCHAITDRRANERLRHRGADWGSVLAGTGFTLAGQRALTIDIEAARSEAVGRYALQSLQRIGQAVAEELSPDDRAALDQLLDAESPNHVLRQPGLAVRTERTAWAAAR